MSLASILGKIGKTALGFIPGVGPAIGGIADVLGGAAKSGAQSNQSRDALKVALSNQQLSRDKFAVDAPSARMKNSLQAALAKHATPSTVQWNGPGSGLRGEVPVYSGGRKSIYDAVKEPDTANLMDTVLHDSLIQQQRGGVSGGNMDDKTMDPSELGKTSILDKVMGGGAFGSSLLTALLKGRGGPTSGASTPGTVLDGYDQD